jgi:8-oxo-dGTP pyrophosphatase MutT (NUDIX family)
MGKILNNVRLIQKCIIVHSDGTVLALKRAGDDHSRGGNWDLPGGGYEQDEDVIESIKREVMEEVGIIAKNVTPVFFANNSAKTGYFQGDNVFGMCYLCQEWEGEIKLSSEHTEYNWIDPKEFAQLNFGEDGGFFKETIKAYLNL